jgi:hypothetical protein
MQLVEGGTHHTRDVVQQQQCGLLQPATAAAETAVSASASQEDQQPSPTHNVDAALLLATLDAITARGIAGC